MTSPQLGYLYFLSKYLKEQKKLILAKLLLVKTSLKKALQKDQTKSSQTTFGKSHQNPLKQEK
jgi:hypothetical protein